MNMTWGLCRHSRRWLYRENERAHLAALVRPPRALAKAAVASGQTKLTALWGAKRARTEATGDDATGPND